MLSKSNSFQRIFTKLHENVGCHILAKFDNHSHRPRHFKIMALDLSKISHFGLVHSLTWIVFTWFSPNSMKMCVPIISRSKLKTSHFTPGTSDLWPFELFKIDLISLLCSLSQTVFNASSSNSFISLVCSLSQILFNCILTKLPENFGGHNILAKFDN